MLVFPPRFFHNKAFLIIIKPLFFYLINSRTMALIALWVLPSCLTFAFRLSTRDEITEQLSPVEGFSFFT